MTYAVYVKRRVSCQALAGSPRYLRAVLAHGPAPHLIGFSGHLIPCAMDQSLLSGPGPRPRQSTHNNLGTINGCYIPCLLNILGAPLFLFVGFAVGMMGWVGALGLFFFSELIAYLTITSFSALVTNGQMKGGGAYYMISRSLGPAFGGSSGMCGRPSHPLPPPPRRHAPSAPGTARMRARHCPDGSGPNPNPLTLTPNPILTLTQSFLAHVLHQRHLQHARLQRHRLHHLPIRAAQGVAGGASLLVCAR